MCPNLVFCALLGCEKYKINNVSIVSETEVTYCSIELLYKKRYQTVLYNCISITFWLRAESQITVVLISRTTPLAGVMLFK